VKRREFIALLGGTAARFPRFSSNLKTVVHGRETISAGGIRPNFRASNQALTNDV